MEQQSFAIRETPVVRIKCSGCVTTALSTSVHDVSSSKNAIVFTERLPQQLRLSFFQPSTLQRKLTLQPAVPFPFALRVVDSDTSIWWSALILSLSRMDLNSYCLPNRASARSRCALYFCVLSSARVLRIGEFLLFMQKLHFVQSAVLFPSQLGSSQHHTGLHE